MATLKEQIVALIGTVCNTSQLDLSDLDKPLLESGLDSLDYVSVLMAIEDKYEDEIEVFYILSFSIAFQKK